jgi:hydrogenase nickel incorporation protein HypB
MDTLHIGPATPRIVEVRKKILDKNDRLAADMRERFARDRVLVVNLVSGPGSGKTELLRRTLIALSRPSSLLGEAQSVALLEGQVEDPPPPFRVAAVTGDLATENDARRLAESGAPARQILTGTMCHLEANMVKEAIEDWDLSQLDFLFIENVGNLVCPGDFDLGEDLRVLLLATTEGEDKPLKYPTLINTADVVVISKVDLAAVVECDLPLLVSNIQAVRPGAAILQVSARTGEGMEDWLSYLQQRLAEKRARR